MRSESRDFCGWNEIAAGLSKLMAREVSVDEARQYEELHGLPIIRLLPRRPQLSPDKAAAWVAALRQRAEERLSQRLQPARAA